MKITKKGIIGAGVGLALGVAGFALADAPIVVINSVNGGSTVTAWASTTPGSSLVLGALPTVVNVNGVVMHDPVDPIKSLKLIVNGTEVANIQNPFNGFGNVDSASFTLPW